MTPPNKTQLIRIVDVLILAPFLVYSGTRKSNLPKFFKMGLVVSGVLTGVYNARNYYLIQQTERQVNNIQTKFQA